MNLISPRVRLPLVELSRESKAEIDKLLAHMGAKYSGCMIGDVTGLERAAVQSVDPTRSKPKFVVVPSIVK